VSEFKFLTRLHYCAPDVDTHGPNAEWGEHEVSVCTLLACGLSTGIQTAMVTPCGADARSFGLRRWITYSSSRRRWM